MNHEQCTIEQVRVALSFIAGVDIRETWVRMGMAVKAEFGDAGFDVWDAWSQQADNYSAGAARSAWKSFKRSASGIGIGTLFKDAIAAGYEFERRELTPEQKQAFAKELEQRRRQREEDERREAEEIAAWHERVAVVAQQLWARLHKVGQSEYLGRKQVKAFGIRFFKSGVVVVSHADRIELVDGPEAISQFFNARNSQGDAAPDFHYFKRGWFAVPMLDVSGKLWNLQLISPKGKKLFLRDGRKQGLYSMLVPVGDAEVVLVAEGYATGASLHMATGYPVALAFDAGNLVPVCNALRDRFAGRLICVCGDNDVATDGNPGKTKAQEAANDVAGGWVVPEFEGAA